MSEIYFPRLNLTILPTYTIPDRWALFSNSAMIEVSIRATLVTAVLSLYGDHGHVDIVRFTGVAMDEIEHKILSWFQARPTRLGWLYEMQGETEAVA